MIKRRDHYCVLTEFVHGQFVVGVAADAVSELWAVPDEELGVGWDGFDGVEVDVQLDLACHQVLLHRVGRVHIVHPVASGDVKPINVVDQLRVLVHLQEDTNVQN